MLYKRRNSKHWQIDFIIAGRTVRRSAGTADRTLAERIEQKLRDEALRAVVLGEVAAPTWEVATADWLRAKAHKRSLNRDTAIFKLAAPYFAGCTLDQIDANALTKYAELVTKRKCAATANRHIALFRALLRAEHFAGRLTKLPVVKAMPVVRPEPTIAPVEAIRAAIEALPVGLRGIANLALHTGLRRSNCVGLRWEWVDLERSVMRVPGIAAKGKKTIIVPITDSVRQILDARREAPDPAYPEYVFGNPKELDKVALEKRWLKAAKAAGIKGFRFHDLRHTWASNHAMNGTPMAILQQLGGWSDARMLGIYSHFTPDSLAKWAGNSQSSGKQLDKPAPPAVESAPL